MIAYAFTLKLNTKADERERATRPFYQEILKDWERCGTLRAACYEKDSKGLCHCHGIIELPEGFRYSSLRPAGCHTCFKEIHDLAGWKRYIHKDQNLMRYVLQDQRLDDIYVYNDAEEDGDDPTTAAVLVHLKRKLFSKDIVSSNANGTGQNTI